MCRRPAPPTVSRRVVGGIRWIGVAIAAGNAILQLLFMPAYPFWSLCLFTLDILVIYGLIARGRRLET
jgi:hypothetical protein